MFLKELQNLDVVEYPLLGFVFRTDGSIYFYDTVSAEIIGISPFMKKLIEALLKKTKALRLKKLSETANLYSEEKVLKGLKIINLKRKNENILEQFSGDFEIGLKDQFHPRKASFNHLVIEVTQNCNLRCKYCIYGENYTHERKYSSAVIDKNAAFKAIKLFLDSPGHPEPKITFFGGEPLLTKELIEDCVKYAKEINPKTVFVIVTNGYLLKPTYFDFIRNHQIRIAVSFDGPKKFHDSYRVLPGGEGTFDEIKSNIEKLYEIDGEYVKKNFSFYITLTDIKNLKEISKFLKQNHLFNNLPVAISKITDAGLKENINEYKNQVPKSKNLKSLLNGYVNNYNEEGFKRVTAEHAYFFPLARLITNRKPLKEKSLFDKVCVLGDWRLFVDVEGNFRICEKTDRLPVIGNADSGIDWEKIDKMKEEFLSTCSPCKNCWAVRICNVCWVDIYKNDGKVDQTIKNDVCKIKLKEFAIGLKVSMELTEKYGDFLKKIPSPND